MIEAALDDRSIGYSRLTVYSETRSRLKRQPRGMRNIRPLACRFAEPERPRPILGYEHVEFRAAPTATCSFAPAACSRAAARAFEQCCRECA
jgi:hypothetical protein